MFDHADMVMINFICRLGGEICRLMDIHLPVDTNDHIGFTFDKTEIVGNRDHGHFFTEPV